ncbi:MAG: MoxR family ATPase [Clostridiales Family XIII bacterium]|jgi:MoxR-like ATPase|nr:MoxR family ATPase [Clostridiales Family XIII bacterium]
MTDSSTALKAIVQNIETVIIGKREVVELVVLCFVCGGHVLIEDVPGVGKTSLVSALAKSVDCGFGRIQFTPDVMPSDVTGFSIFNQKTREFEFRPGAVMSNIILADEINRASAKTQSSLLEAMEERQITVDGETRTLPEPFMVLATQNPLESFGTYPLPEAQVDRFLIKTGIGYPSFEQEIAVVELGDRGRDTIAPVVTGADVLSLRAAADAVRIDPKVTGYIVEIVAATRSHADIRIGASPRGSIALHRLAKVWALYSGRGYVIPDDVKRLAPFVLAHRIALTQEARLAGRTPVQVVGDILGSVVVPVER